jgi:hypothetical protein
MPNPTLNSYFKMLDRLVVSRLSSKLRFIFDPTNGEFCRHSAVEVSRKALLVIRLPV